MEQNPVTRQLLRIAQWESFKVLHRTKIDKHRWDALVLSADGPLYATFDYLSSCGEWEAVVFEGDHLYWCAVPIPYRERVGVKYIYQSPFICYLTFLSRPDAASSSPQFLNTCFNHLRSFAYVAKYFFCDSSFNELEGFKISFDGGLKIDLTRGYCHIVKGYSRHRSIDLRKAAKSDMIISMYESIDQFFEWHAELSVPKIKSFQPYQLTEMRMLWENLEVNGQIEVYFAAIGREMLCGTLLGKFGTSLYSLASFTTPRGRKKNALTLVTDHVLKKYAQSDYSTFDFGNLTGTGIDNFKLSFGAVCYPIHRIYRNDLPWYIRIPKSILNFFRVSVS
jgi:hypothetical protein